MGGHGSGALGPVRSSECGRLHAGPGLDKGPHWQVPRDMVVGFRQPSCSSDNLFPVH